MAAVLGKKAAPVVPTGGTLVTEWYGQASVPKRHAQAASAIWVEAGSLWALIPQDVRREQVFLAVNGVA